MNTLTSSTQRAAGNVASKLTSLAWVGFKLSFGLFSLAAVWSSAVIKSGALWARDTKEHKQELAAAQEKHWSLNGEPLPGFRHAFFKTRTGVSLHYVVNCDKGSSASKNVAVFIHGFPDSFLLWRHILQSPDLLRNQILVAVDLPGYGGSDSLPVYGPNEVLEALSEFLIETRNLYLQEGRKIVVVTHDWGAVVGARLASEASDLADHWILTSLMIPHLAASNALTQTVLCRQMLHTWIRSPFNFRLLQNGLRALRPIVSQFQRSFYVFCFLLPWPFSTFFATFGNYWFLRVMHDFGKGARKRTEKTFWRLSTQEAAEAMAMSAGPSLAQMNEFEDIKYGESVQGRMSDYGMAEKIRIYREGLFLGEWQKSLEVTAALFELAIDGSSSVHSTSSRGPFLDNGPKGAFRAPITLIVGERDPAFERRLALEGIKDFLVKGSQVVLVKGGGHWLPLEPVGRRILEKTVQWTLHENSQEPESDLSPFATMSDVRILEAL